MKDWLIISLISLFGFKSYAWGPTGHRAVGEIAQQHVKKSTLQKINKLLDGHSLARVSNWPDKIKSDPDKYSYTFHWHYTDWPDTQGKYDSKNNSGSLVKSISDNLDVLKNKKASKEDRAFALKFVVHLVGDLHQPLHVGNGKDRGGNSCKLFFHKEKVNLHQLWDESLIRFSRLSYKELSEFVSVRTKSERKNWTKGNLLEWAKESKELRTSVYPKDPITGLTGANSTKLKYCDRENPPADDSLPKIGYKYSYEFMPILERRIFQAGIRLARLLDEAL